MASNVWQINRKAHLQMIPCLITFKIQTYPQQVATLYSACLKKTLNNIKLPTVPV